MSKIKASTWAILLILILIPALSCYTPVMSPSTSATKSDIPGYLVYKDKSGIFSISYPQGWEAGRWNLEEFIYETTAEEGLNTIKSGHPVQSFYTIFASFKWVQDEIVASVFIRLNGRFIGDPYRTIDEAEKGQKRTRPDMVELSRTEVTVNGKQGVIREWTGTNTSAEEQVKEYNLELYVPTDRAVWIVSCSADSDNVSEWQPYFNNIARSLKIYYIH